MFKEKKVLRKLLVAGGILLILFLGLVIAWEICVGSVNRKYKLPGMKKDDFGDYLLVGDMGEYYWLIPVSFPSFDLSGLQLTVSFGRGRGEAKEKYLPTSGRVQGYPDLSVESATFDIFPSRKLEDGRYMIFLTTWDHATDYRGQMYSMNVDAQGEFYLAPGVMVDAETQALARAFVDAEWREYLVSIAREAWGDKLFQDP